MKHVVARYRGQRLVLRPGTGWKHLGGPVYEHESGTRIHLLCPLVRLPDMSMIYIDRDRQRFYLLMRANGGNRKRATMAYALTLMAEQWRTAECTAET